MYQLLTQNNKVGPTEFRSVGEGEE